jgi:hypothetical protein
MNSKDLAEEFIKCINLNFPEVKIKFPTIKRPNRVSLYVPNKNRDKRWMQLEWLTESISVEMDHLKDDITEHIVMDSGVPYGKLNGINTRIILHNDIAVNLFVSIHELIDFESNKFISFLITHFSSYLKRVNGNDLIKR